MRQKEQSLQRRLLRVRMGAPSLSAP
jgi:hypothetical protein